MFTFTNEFLRTNFYKYLQSSCYNCIVSFIVFSSADLNFQHITAFFEKPVKKMFLLLIINNKID